MNTKPNYDDITPARHTELVNAVAVLAKSVGSLPPIERAAVALMTPAEKRNPIRDDRALEIAVDAANLVGKSHIIA